LLQGVVRNYHVSEVLFSLPGFELSFLHADGLSILMGYIFAIIGSAAILYPVELVKESGELVCSLLYLRSALGAVFAGGFFVPHDKITYDCYLYTGGFIAYSMVINVSLFFLP
jgi:formate hydrogenlyase subunit 3/multisubunit Na+/H+ antiporter MnhD subunit